MGFMSLRLQLALVLSFMLMATLCGLGIAAHWLVSQNSYTEVRNNLAGDASIVAERLLASNDLAPRHDVSYSYSNLEDAVSPFESEDPNTLTKTPIFDICLARPAKTAGALQRRMQQAISTGDAFPLSEDGFAAILRAQPWSETVEVTEGGLAQTHLVYNKPVFKNNQLVSVAQVAQSIEPLEARLLQFRNWWLLGSGTATMLMFGLTLVVASRGLNPLKRIAQMMQAAAQHDASGPATPLVYSSTHATHFTHRASQFHGELNELATSLNTMLNELNVAHQQTQSQKDFVADVSHELRAPLTTVRGNLGLLQRNLSDDDRQAILRDAVDEIERMSRLVNQLLLVARASTPHATEKSFCCEPVLLRPLIEEMGRKAARLMQGKAFSLNVAEGVPAQVAALGNPDALKQVLLILLDNAAKFTPRGGQVALSLGMQGQWATLSVQDNGVGISAEDMAHVFERGFSGSRLGVGNGLGLSIARQLIEAQGGQILVSSKVDAGSVFSVIIRLVD
jgi:signal transduction histidine kinase